MKILVPIKRVLDTDQKVRIAADDRNVETAGLPCIINPFDAIALEEAVRLRESGVDVEEIVVVSVGTPEVEEQLRTALAVGADRAIRVAVDDALDPWNVSSLLLAMVEFENPRLVLMGKQAVDDDCNQTGQFLAARLGWPQATFASKVEWLGNEIRVRRETDTGRETVRVPLPAVVTADLRLNEPRYASLPSIMRARKMEISEIRATSLGVVMQPRIQIVRLRSENSTRQPVRVESPQRLVELLQARHGLQLGN